MLIVDLAVFDSHLLPSSASIIAIDAHLAMTIDRRRRLWLLHLAQALRIRKRCRFALFLALEHLRKAGASTEYGRTGRHYPMLETPLTYMLGASPALLVFFSL